MSNKKIFKEMYSNKINKDKNFKEIIDNINNDELKKSYKWVLAPLCFVLIICISVLIDNNNLTFKDRNNNYNINCESNDKCNQNNTSFSGKDDEININKVQNLSSDTSRWNATYETVDINELSKEYDFIKNFDFIFEDLELSETNRIIFTANKNEYLTEDCINLINYELVYSNKDNTKNIKISFSKYDKPIRDYYFSSENSKESIINNHEFIIYQYEKLYMVEFIYNNINIDIETENINELQLKLLLGSIVL